MNVGSCNSSTTFCLLRNRGQMKHGEYLADEFTLLLQFPKSICLDEYKMANEEVTLGELFFPFRFQKKRNLSSLKKLQVLLSASGKSWINQNVTVSVENVFALLSHTEVFSNSNYRGKRKTSQLLFSLLGY